VSGGTAGWRLGRARDQYAALLPMTEMVLAGAPGNAARHVCRTGAANSGTGPGMKKALGAVPCERAERKPVSSRRWKRRQARVGAPDAALTVSAGMADR
jgi:hypothetical protein